MKNREIAQIFYEIAEFLEMEDIAFRPYAYERAAVILENLKKDIEEVYEAEGLKGLESISGIGKTIARRIEEYLKTGRIKYYQELKNKTPVKVSELTAVEGLGPKTVKTLYKELNIKNLKDLEKAVKNHRIAPLFGFGEKTEKNILEAIKFLKRSGGRFLLGDILPEVEKLQVELRGLKQVDRLSVAGSVRRRKETIGDVDLLAVSKKPDQVMDIFVSLPGVIKIWGKGRTKSSVRMKPGFDIDLRVVPEKSYGSALQYFTGSKEHNIALRKIAMDKGLKLNEYGLFKGPRMIGGRTEEQIYRAMGIKLIPPELREDSGEIEAGFKRKLPELIELKDIKGDLHCHSNWNGGRDSILELAEYAKAKGYEYLGISDHTKFLRIEHGLDERQLSRQGREIDKLNKKLKNFKLFKGAETNILKDGSIDIKDETLKKLDYAIAGVHSNLKMNRSEMTDRIIKAMKNPYIKILAHPTGRILKKRDEYYVYFDKILRAAKEFKVVLEINASPYRLDLNDVKARAAVASGVKLSINSDAHRKEQMDLMEFGVYQARRGWVEKKDVINCFSSKHIFKNL